MEFNLHLRGQFLTFFGMDILFQLAWVLDQFFVNRSFRKLVIMIFTDTELVLIGTLMIMYCTEFVLVRTST